MDGVHDLGGMAGFRGIEIEADEPAFHEPWESLAFRLNLSAIGVMRVYNTDEYRHAIERMAPAHYLSASYYERVLTGVATLLVEKGVIALADLESRAGGRFPLAQPVIANSDDGRTEPIGAQFHVGDTVRVRDVHPLGHTRAPRYVRGRSGTVLRVVRPFKFPDAEAHGLPRRREPTYHVEFAAADLWPDTQTSSADTVVVDLWQTYLEETT